MTKDSEILLLEIELFNIDPKIYRQVLIAKDGTFWDLHMAIQDVMGWEDAHLHAFQVTSDDRQITEIGVPNPDDDMEVQAGWDIPITAFLSKPRKTLRYLYDFGDSWEHKVTLEKIMVREPEGVYPACVGGARACPPEDSGGPFGYQYKLDVLMDQNHEDYERIQGWMGDDFDAEAFKASSVRFRDSQEVLASLRVLY